MKKLHLNRATLIKMSVPAILIPGLILAAQLDWNWQKQLKSNLPYTQNQQIFPTTAIVNKITDGDTIVLKNGAAVRLIGVDAPDQGQAYFYIAKELTNNLLLGKTVELEYEPHYQNDPYGRLLAYVWVGQGNGRRLVNKALLASGLAKVALYGQQRKLKYQDQFIEAESQAKSQKLNLWSPSPQTP